MPMKANPMRPWLTAVLLTAGLATAMPLRAETQAGERQALDASPAAALDGSARG